MFKNTHNSQSIARIIVTSSVGNPTAVRTITMVTRPACGTPAAPIAAAVAVILEVNNLNLRNYIKLVCAVFWYIVIFSF